MRLYSSFTSALTRNEAFAGKPSPDHDFWYSKISRLFGFGSSAVRADVENVWGLPAVFACVRVMALSPASIPLEVFERKPGNDRERVSNNPISRVLRRPNRWQYHFKWVAMQFAHQALRGNCYSQIVRNRRGEVDQLIPLNPTRITVEQGKRGYLLYILDAEDNNKRRVFDQSEIFHAPALTTDGLVGVSPITQARRLFEERLASREYRTRFYENSAQPSGILKMPGALKDEEAVKRLKKTWADAHAGVKNAHKVAVLENGLEWQQIGLSAKDNDYVNEERLGLEDIARLFGIPPHKIGDLSRATNNNIEHQSIEFVRDCLMPWLKNFEEALMFALLTEREAERYFIEFNVDGLLRGDYKTRQEGLAIQRQNGIITANEWRRLENMNARPDDEGDTLVMNGNMIPVKMAGVQFQQKAAPAPANQDEQDQPQRSAPNLEPLRRAHRGVLGEVMGRLVRKEAKWCETNAEKPDFVQLRGVFLQNHRQFAADSLRIAAQNYAISLFFALGNGENATPEAVDLRVDESIREFCGAYFVPGELGDVEKRVARLTEVLGKMIETLVGVP